MPNNSCLLIIHCHLAKVLDCDFKGRHENTIVLLNATEAIIFAGAGAENAEVE